MAQYIGLTPGPRSEAEGIVRRRMADGRKFWLLFRTARKKILCSLKQFDNGFALFRASLFHKLELTQKLYWLTKISDGNLNKWCNTNGTLNLTNSNLPFLCFAFLQQHQTLFKRVCLFYSDFYTMSPILIGNTKSRHLYYTLYLHIIFSLMPIGSVVLMLNNVRV